MALTCVMFSVKLNITIVKRKFFEDVCSSSKSLGTRSSILAVALACKNTWIHGALRVLL